MRKQILLLLVFAAGCDATRRDLAVCDQNHQDCSVGYYCDFGQGQCISGSRPVPDAALPDTVVIGGSDTSPPVDQSMEVGVGPSDAAADVPAIDAGPGVDASVDVSVDASGPDTALPDTRAPDAAGTCSVDRDCVTDAGISYCLSGICVGCKTTSQCSNDAGVPFCSLQNTCVSCAAVDAGCVGGTPTCDPSSGSCVQCVSNNDCPTAGKSFCVQNKCVGCGSVPSSSADGGVSGGASVDGGTSGPCSGVTPACAASGPLAGQCVQCVSSTDCTGVTTPICNTTTSKCTACTSDDQCAKIPGGPGVCMFHQDGRCATNDETIYVKNPATCVAGAGIGTLALPFCLSQDGINAAISGSNQNLVVLLGPDPLSGFNAKAAAGDQLSVVGQKGATINPGVVFPGIEIAAGDVYVRGVTVLGGSKVGIQADPGATLRLDRCIVKSNAGGGLIVQPGANFDVANSVFDSNGPGLFGTTTSFGGIYLGGGAPANGPSRLWFSTVISSKDRGVICHDTSQALTGMLLYQNINGDYLSCAMDVTSEWQSGTPIPSSGASYNGPPNLDTTYHLTASSHCRDLISATVAHPADDIDGDARPKGPKLDCGADEY